ncbi:RNA-binding S4 domain-containing protein [Roseovarius sp. SCSIO 43702]|uniref:RNA-binding S4 domain-containing protein n=1 Tax=Roseovarius sp. SCSIO 43702 TaxID=2823043 RepID=UPI001C731FA1|nr:RNA-binding S4 domain-containing protein [Roseovarius sp. SCSIO 43702]QYX58234.1 RNA-binding S4 domain-containing protein [Roseovarius sp. SCSIO 43702]
MTDPAAPQTLRADKWLWHARFFKTRALSARMIEGGKLRVNSGKVSKAGRAIRPGDVLTITLPGGVRVVRVLALGTRRGPASEAQALYEEMT